MAIGLEQGERAVRDLYDFCRMKGARAILERVLATFVGSSSAAAP
jgi:hypothetical protein